MDSTRSGIYCRMFHFLLVRRILRYDEKFHCRFFSTPFILVHKIPPLLRGTNRIEAEEAEAASRMQQQEDEQEEEEHLRIDNEAVETTRLLKQEEEEECLQILEAEATTETV